MRYEHLSPKGKRSPMMKNSIDQNIHFQICQNVLTTDSYVIVLTYKPRNSLMCNTDADMHKKYSRNKINIFVGLNGYFLYEDHLSSIFYTMPNR